MQAQAHLTVLNATGWHLPLFNLLRVQTVTKHQCTQRELIARQLSADHYLSVNRTTVEPNEPNNLNVMLQAWCKEQLTPDNYASCISQVPGHGGASVIIRKIVSMARCLMIHFPRIGQHIRVSVDIPEYLGVSPFSNRVALPSDSTGSGPAITVAEPIYRLKQINMYFSHDDGAAGPSGHYVSYVISSDGRWYCFDDLAERKARVSNPQRAINRGGFANYLVYEVVLGPDEEVPQHVHAFKSWRTGPQPTIPPEMCSMKPCSQWPTIAPKTCSPKPCHPRPTIAPETCSPEPCHPRPTIASETCSLEPCHPRLTIAPETCSPELYHQPPGMSPRQQCALQRRYWRPRPRPSPRSSVLGKRSLRRRA